MSPLPAPTPGPAHLAAPEQSAVSRHSRHQGRAAGAARGSPGRFTPTCVPGCQTELPGSLLPHLWTLIWVQAGVCEHPGGDGCGRGRDVPAAGQGACSHGHCEETTPHPRDSLCCPQVWPCRAGWVPPARHGEGFGSGPRQPCVARGRDTRHGNTSTSGKLCSQEGWIAAGTANNLQVHGGKQCWRLPNKLPGITTRAWCLCIKAEARASTPTESGQIIN